MEYFVEEYFDQNPISQVMHLTLDLCICLWVFTEYAASVNCTVSSTDRDHCHQEQEGGEAHWSCRL